MVGGSSTKWEGNTPLQRMLGREGAYATSEFRSAGYYDVLLCGYGEVDASVLWVCLRFKPLRRQARRMRSQPRKERKNLNNEKGGNRAKSR